MTLDSVPGLRLRDERFGWRNSARLVVGALLVLNIAVLLFVLSMAHVTSEGPAKRSLGQSVAVLTEVDAYLDDRYEALRLEAFQAAPDDELALPDFPIELSFQAGEIADADQDEFRALLLDAAAERVLAEGSVVIKEDPGAEVSFFSTAGAVRTGMDFLRPTPHRVLTIMAIALASMAGLLAAALVMTARGYGRVLAIGLAVVAAAAPFAVLAVALRFALRVAGEGLDEYLATEFLELAQELTWAPIRNGLIFAVGGAVIATAGAALANWSDRSGRISIP